MRRSGPDHSARAAYRALCVPAPDGAAAVTRRRFLQAAATLGGASALSGVLPGWVREAYAAPPLGEDEGVLVIVMMGGGNDALNMVVPYTDGAYYSARPDVAIAPGAVLPLDDRLGLHPALGTLRSLYEQRRVAVVQGVGTHDPDLSHFVSLADWMRGWAGNGTPTTGWIGRWLDAVAADPFHAIHLGSSVPMHLVGATRTASALGERAPFGAEPEPYWRDLRDAVAAYGAQPSGLGRWGDALAAAQCNHLRLASAVGGLYQPALPAATLPARLTLAARLIDADLGVRVLSVAWGDFDSHNGHRAMHDARMAEFDAALGAFWAALPPRWHNRVTLMTFSEFGRRVAQNGNAGIDHGTAGTMLLVGPQVRGGLHGQSPSLTALRDGYPTATVHYNEVYAAVLERWMRVDAASVLGGRTDQLDGLFAAAPGVISDAPPPGPTPAGDLVAIAPARRLDTRTGQGVGAARRLGAGGSLDLAVAGIGDVPAQAVTAVVMNVTAVTPTKAGYLTVWPAFEPRPLASNVNFAPGDVVPNLVLAKVGAYGMVSIYNAAGDTDVVADVVGYLREGTTNSLIPVQPTRLLDTRTDRVLGPGAERSLVVTGGSIPATGVDSVVLNVTVTEPTAPTFVTVYPDGLARPLTSNLNALPRQTVPNLVVAKVGAGGRVRLFNSAGNTHLVVDLLGYVSGTGTGTGTGRVVATTPTRLYDSRRPETPGPLRSGEERLLTFGGQGGLPAGGVGGVVVNVTITEPTQAGYLTVWPADRPRPTTSNLNFVAGQTVPNLVVCAVDRNGALKLFSPHGRTHVVIDLVGYVT